MNDLDPTNPKSEDSARPQRGFIPAVRLTWRAIQVRLRFVILLLVAFAVIGNWETIRNRTETLVRRAFGPTGVTSDQAVSTDTEYFCPMDPGILSDWPGRCGACNMALVRRKKGEGVPRPDGVVARMQFSPYRVQLAGLLTASANYQALAREVTGVGTVHEVKTGCGVVIATFFERDFSTVVVGRQASVSGDVLPHGQPPLSGRVAKVGPGTAASIEIDDPKGLLRPGASVTAKVRVPIAEIEPFCSLPNTPPELVLGECRTLYSCPEHPETHKESPGRCPVDRNALQPTKLADNQRVRWWCPMHPEVTADEPGAKCASCDGMKLVPRVITYLPPGQVLAVPEPAVVDTGTRTVAFVERMPGMFDAVEIVVGPRCGGYYPVFSGLEPGDRVAAAGALLIDAETRLNPSLAAAYFGATGAGRAEPSKPAETPKPEICPVRGRPLGSMGPPVRVELNGQTVWLCCDGCEAALRMNPEKYLTKGARREPAVSPRKP